MQEALKAAHTTPLWYRRGLCWHLRKKKTQVTSGERLVLSRNTPFNFISHYISNLITWWNVTPAGVPGCRGSWKDPGELTVRPPHVCATVGGSQPLPASAVRRDLAFPKRQQLSLSHELSGHIKAERSALQPTPPPRSGQKIRPHTSTLKNRALHSLSQPQGVKLERPLNPDTNHGNAVRPQPQLPSPWN